MAVGNSVSTQTKRNWLIDAGLFGSAVLASLSGIYFLYLPVGYQGGRNPLANVKILLTRQGWEDLHTWAGVIMITVAVIHLALHWSWVINMAKRMAREITGRCGCMNRQGRFNLWLNITVAISFLFVAISGLYFFFFPGNRWSADPMFLLSRQAWDLVHTWAGVILIGAAVLHFTIHWKWVVKVARNLLINSTRGASLAAAQATIETK